MISSTEWKFVIVLFEFFSKGSIFYQVVLNFEIINFHAAFLLKISQCGQTTMNERLIMIGLKTKVVKVAASFLKSKTVREVTQNRKILKKWPL